MSGVEGLPDDAVQRLAAVLREPLDDGVLMHTGRSIGDLASERVAREAAAALAPVVAALVREAAATELEAAALHWRTGGRIPDLLDDRAAELRGPR